jgi:hypothetical protein
MKWIENYIRIWKKRNKEIQQLFHWDSATTIIRHFDILICHFILIHSRIYIWGINEICVRANKSSSPSSLSSSSTIQIFLTLQFCCFFFLAKKKKKKKGKIRKMPRRMRHKHTRNILRRVTQSKEKSRKKSISLKKNYIKLNNERMENILMSSFALSFPSSRHFHLLFLYFFPLSSPTNAYYY